MERARLLRIIRYRLGCSETAVLEDFATDIRMIYDVRYSFSKEQSKIFTDKTLDYPAILASSHTTLDILPNLRPDNEYTLLKHGDIIIDLTDTERMTLAMIKKCERCYADSGMSIVSTDNINKSIFLYWYLSLDEVVEYIDVNPVINIRTVPVPVDEYLISDVFVKRILDTMVIESSVKKNAIEISDRLREIRAKMIDDIKNKVGTCQ